MKYQFISAHREEFEITVMCRVFEVSRSGYYAWLKRPISPREMANQALKQQIKEIHQHSRQTYGSPRIHAELRAQGIKCGHNRVARLMRQEQLWAKQKRKFRVTTTDSTHSYPVAPNLLDQDFTASQPNETWLTDITYIPTAEGWLYLAVVMDLYTRMIVGWSMGPRMTRDLVIDALRMAYFRRRPKRGLMHHSDRGSQPGLNWSSQHCFDPQSVALH